MVGGVKQEPETKRYRVTGMDCPDCASRIERTVRRIEGVREARVSLASRIMTLHLDVPSAASDEVEREVAGLGYGLDRLGPSEDSEPSASQITHITPAYKRALWIVVALNLGYGAVEAIGGVLSGSQALKADALDFLGDGLITGLGLLAITWSLLWRARSALLQGLFLGALGVGVLLSTAYRVMVLNEPQPHLMGLLGAIALVVNAAAALVLLPHRTGDANVRAVWHFSRNDAIGNAAVVTAAGLVAWTGSAWPDLVVAAAIAGLFLHSSLSIVGDAHHDLRQVTRR